MQRIIKSRLSLWATPTNLKRRPRKRSKMGRGSSKVGGTVAQLTYDRIPFAALFKGASKEDAKKRRDTVGRFIKEAEAGNVYLFGPGIGSSGSTFEVVSYRRSKNGLGIKDGRRTVALTSANVLGYIKNGAKLIRKR